MNNGPVHRIPSMRVAEIERIKSGDTHQVLSQAAINWRERYILEHTT